MSKKYDRPLTIEEMANVPDKDIDFSDIPELGEEFWRKSVWVDPEGTQQVTLRVKTSVLAAYRATGKGYQTRMNAVLESYARTLPSGQKQKAEPSQPRAKVKTVSSALPRRP